MDRFSLASSHLITIATQEKAIFYTDHGVKSYGVCYNQHSTTAIFSHGQGEFVSWKIVVAHGNLSFSAAHFISLEGTYEPLHGHNYGVSAELTGETLTADSYLLDFGILKSELRALISEVNHRFLLPLHNPHMRVSEAQGEWEIHLANETRFIMPTSSVVALPMDNVTAERLAGWFAERLSAALRERGIDHLLTLTVGVSETEMQCAYHTIDLRI